MRDAVKEAADALSAALAISDKNLPAHGLRTPECQAVYDHCAAALTALQEQPAPVWVKPLPVLHIVFDGPPSHDGGRFVEVETPDGKSIRAGEWRERSDGLWELRLSALQPSPAREEAEALVEKLRASVEWYGNDTHEAAAAFIARHHLGDPS
jgi:hypothetical protein